MSSWGPPTVLKVTELRPPWGHTFPKTSGKEGRQHRFRGQRLTSEDWGSRRLKVDSEERGQIFAPMVCSTAEMISGGACLWFTSLPPWLGLGEGEDERYNCLGEQCAFRPAVDICTCSGLNVKCHSHAYVFQHLVTAGGTVWCCGSFSRWGCWWTWGTSHIWLCLWPESVCLPDS